MCSPLPGESNKKTNRFMVNVLSQEISEWVNPRGTPYYIPIQCT